MAVSYHSWCKKKKKKPTEGDLHPQTKIVHGLTANSKLSTLFWKIKYKQLSEKLKYDI